MIALDQHQLEIEKNLRSWRTKPLLQEIYRGFYGRILKLIDAGVSGTVVEIGSGIGNLKEHRREAICTDLFPNPWLDVVCDGYELPFASATVSHLVLFDVFHHLRAPRAFLKEAQRVLAPQGRVILFEPYISHASRPVYGLLHHEPIAWRQSISSAEELPRPRDYYAGQGNATRIYFRGEHPEFLRDWTVFHTEVFSAFSYLLSGGYSKPACYPAACLGALRRMDEKLSRWPRLFGARCLVGLTR